MAFDPDAYLSGGTATDTFDPDAYLAGSPTPSGTPEGGENGFLAKVNAALRKPSPEALQAPEAAVRELVGGMMPHDIPSYLESLFPPAAMAHQAVNLGEGLAQGDVSGVPLIGRIPEIMQADETPAGSKERYLTAMKTLMDLGMLAGGGEGAREPVAPEAPPVESPPIQPEAPPPEMPMQSTPLPPEAFAPPAPQVPPPPIGTPLNGVPLVGPAGQTAADVAAAQVQPQLPVSQEGGPPLVLPGDEPYAGVTAQAPSQVPPIQEPTAPVGGNVAGFEQVYGPGEVPAGPTLTPEDAWDAAQARAQSGKAQPYNFVSRAKTGAITPEEMGDLIYEHHRLVERAAGLEGTPQYDGAYQAALDFANNVLKPAETAWHQKGMTMQIARPVDLSNMTGMDTLMRQELNRGIKPSEAPKFKQMAQDIGNGQSEVQKAVARSDAKVQRSYAKVADIPIEEAVARVKQMLKDCM